MKRRYFILRLFPCLAISAIVQPSCLEAASLTYLHDIANTEDTIHRITLDHDILSVGIISDSQFPEEDELLSPGHFGVVMKGPYHFIRAVRYFKERKVD